MRSFIISLFFLLTMCHQQLCISQSLTEAYIDGASLGNTNAFYYSPGYIISPSISSQPTNVSGSGHVEFKAGISVALKDGFSAYGMTGSGFFHAVTAPPDFEVVFIEPDQSNPTVGRYEKLELGLKLPASINQDVNTFLNDVSSTTLNPYDPDQINIEAIFTQGNVSYKCYGFYYRDYVRDPITVSTPDVPAVWNDVPTDYEWRVRFAPPENGNWTCDIQVYLSGHAQPDYSVPGLQFTVEESGKSGFLEVSDDSRHFKTSNGNDFFPIGQNIAWTDEPVFRGSWFDYDPSSGNGVTNPNFIHRLHGTGFLDLLDHVNNLAANGGNLARIVSDQDCYLYEWEELGVYGSNRDSQDENFLRQKRSWELDRLLDVAEMNNIKLLFCLEYHGQWQYVFRDPITMSYHYNPYVTTFSHPPDFFSDQSSIQAYKKKLRYFLARWGYSSALGVLQYFSELDNWSYDLNEFIHDRKNSIPLANDIDAWHSTMGSYVRTSTPRPILLTSGFGSDAHPTSMIGKFNTSDEVDLIIHNRYGNDRGENWEMHGEAQNYITLFDKPFMYTETGLALDATNQQDADPSDMESCDDVVFHNFLWAGAVMGSAGTSLNWWQWFDDSRRMNYTALATFINNVDMNAYQFKVNRRWPNNTMLNCDNIVTLDNNAWIESYSVGAKDPSDNNRINRVFGWAHNLTYYWWNLSSYRSCQDRWSMSAQNTPCDDDPYNSPVFLPGPNNNIIEIHGLKINASYHIEWYGTYGNGGVIATGNTNTNILGVATYHLPGTMFDYAFKVNKTGSPFHELESSYHELLNDTIYCGDDTIVVEDPGDPGYTYSWDFGNGTGSSSATPTIVYSKPGSYTVTLITTDSLGNSDTLVQTIVKLPCDIIQEEESKNLSHEENPSSNDGIYRKISLEKYISISPNPNHGDFNVSIISPMEINTTLQITDLWGSVLYTLQVHLQEGTTYVPIRKNELPSGIYLIRVNGFDETLKAVIAK